MREAVEDQLGLEQRLLAIKEDNSGDFDYWGLKAPPNDQRDQFAPSAVILRSSVVV